MHSPRVRMPRDGGGWSSLWLLAALLFGCDVSLPGHEQNLLIGVEPMDATDVTFAERLSDGEIPVEGDAWLTSLSTAFKKSGAEVTFDLGSVRDIHAALIVADNNDRFDLQISEDGEKYTRLWKIDAVKEAGMRERHVDKLNGHGRYLRLRAFGGDRSISAGELMVFDAMPKKFPPDLVRFRGFPPEVPGIIVCWLFFVCVLVFALLCEPTQLLWVRVARPVSLLLAIYCLWHLATMEWPPPEPVQEMFRATVALSALALVLRGMFRSQRTLHGHIRAGLVLCGFASLACFYNFFAPQFDNAAKGRKTYVHTWDMRVYYPIAKYFDALNFDGLYFASVAAYRSHGPGLSERALANVHLRDLRTNQMTTGDKVKDAIDAAPSRFAPGEYDEFAEDMRFFWETMGGGYLASLRDHGGNATPAWFWLTHWMFKYTKASEPVLLAFGALDPLLLLLLLIAVYRSFGPTTALLCLIIFGTTEFPQFGSNWAGSTFRLDWMVAAGLAACALRTRRDNLAGVLLAVAGLIRAFPTLCAITGCLALLIPQLHFSKLDFQVSFRRFRAVALSGLLTVGIAAVLAGTTFGWEQSWGRWFHKISMHTDEPNVNHVGLRTVLATDLHTTPRQLERAGDKAPWASWQKRQLENFDARKVWFYAICALYVAMVVIAAARMRPEQAAVMGLLLVPVFFYPANYYMHGIFILPMMAVESATGNRFIRGRHVAPVLLLWCAAQYISYVKTYTDERFYQQSAQFLVATVLLVLPFCFAARKKAREDDAVIVAPASKA